MTDFPWTAKPPRFKVGDELYSNVDKGRVVEVDAEANTMRVSWDDGAGGVITYPMDASYLEEQPPEKMPWE